MAPNCGVCLRVGAPPLLSTRPLGGLLGAHTDELQAGAGDRLEAVHLLGVGAGEHVAEDQREEDGLLGEKILRLAPLGLGGIAFDLAGLWRGLGFSDRSL